MTVAYLLLALGLLGVYCEFLRPGRVFPLAGGLLLFAFGARQLPAECPLPGKSMLLLAAAVCLWLLDCWLDTRFVGSITASGAILVATALHARPCHKGSLVPLLLISFAFSSVTTVLIHLGRRARMNKWSDL